MTIHHFQRKLKVKVLPCHALFSEYTYVSCPSELSGLAVTSSTILAHGGFVDFWVT